MHLVDDWKAIFKRAWSIKLNIIAVTLSGAEVFVGVIKPDNIPNGMFAILAGFTTIAAMVARMMAQKELHDGRPK